MEAGKFGINLSLAVVDSFALSLEDADMWGVDFIIEFPPHGFCGKDTQINKVDYPLVINPNFRGAIHDYRKVVCKSVKKEIFPESVRSKYVRGIMPSWDNTARRQNNGLIFYKSSPETFFRWFRYLISESIQQKKELIFINAWNEWAEGAHLEPDLLYGLKFLEKTKQAKNYFNPDLLMEKKSLLEFLRVEADESFLRSHESLKKTYKMISMSKLFKFIKYRLVGFIGKRDVF